MIETNSKEYEESINECQQEGIPFGSNSQIQKSLCIQKYTVEPQQRFGHKPTIIYRAEIDGLRCLAILPVICFHFELFQDFTSGGFGGVDVFFVISGFLVNSIIISELFKEKFSLLTFYERRVRRLFPAIFTVLAIILALGYILYYDKEKYQELVWEEGAALASSANIYFYLKKDDMGDGYFGDNTQEWPFLHFWSLAVEEQFYMITPIALMLLMKYTKKRNFLKGTLIYLFSTILISLILSIWLTESDQMFAFYLLPCRAWQLGLGGLIAILLNDQTMRKMQPFFSRFSCFCNRNIVTLFLEVISWAGLLMILFSYAYYNKKKDHFPGYKALLPCCGVAMFIAANFVRKYETAYQKPRNNSTLDVQCNQKRILLSSARLLSWRPIVLIGEISYSLYLWHWPIWVLLNYSMIESEITLINKIFCVAQTFMIAYLSTQTIENPIRNKKTVPTSALWKGFSITLICFIIVLASSLVLKVGGVVIKDLQKPEIEINKNFLYPKYDSEGYLIQNPYRSLTAQEISLKKFGQPMSASHLPNNFMKYPTQSVVDGPFRDLEPILINYSEEDKRNNKRLCIATVGSSHTEQHHETMRELAYEYNVSLGLFACSGTVMSFSSKNKKEWDQWRNKHFHSLKPRFFFAQNDWRLVKKLGFNETYKNSFDPLLSLPTPPDYIGVFGDHPYAGIQDLRTSSLKQVLIRRYNRGGNSWNYLENLTEVTLQQQIQKEAEVANQIQKKYKNTVVHFYPHIHQFMQDRVTGNIQMVGSQVDGRLLYYNKRHLSLDGSKRYKRYFQEKIFKRAKEICQ